MPIRLLVLILPLAEIATFILVGREIGVAATLALVLISAICGFALLRVTGVATLLRIRTEMEANRVPARPLAEGAMMALGSILLIVPGFITDLIGLALFLPAIRSGVFRWFSGRVVVRSSPHAAPPRPGEATTIDLDEEDYSAEPRPGSPWRRLDRS